MLSRSHVQQKIKAPADHTPVGKVFQVQGSDLYIHAPSWFLGEIDGLQLIPKTHSSQGTYCHKRIADAFFAYHSTSTIPTKKICDHLNITAKQSKDDLLSVIIQAFQTRDLGKECFIDHDDHRTPIYKKLLNKFFLEPGTSVLMSEKVHTHQGWSCNTNSAADFFIRHHSHEGTPIQLLLGIQKSRHWNLCKFLQHTCKM